jgi:hypothetical protein
MSWFAAGQVVSLVAAAWLGHASFGMPAWETAIAVVRSFWLALVACRVTGATDTTPVGAIRKVTQLIFGALRPGNVNVNLMSTNITAGVFHWCSALLFCLSALVALLLARRKTEARRGVHLAGSVGRVVAGGSLMVWC